MVRKISHLKRKSFVKALTNKPSHVGQTTLIFAVTVPFNPVQYFMVRLTQRLWEQFE